MKKKKKIDEMDEASQVEKDGWIVLDVFMVGTGQL